MWLSIVLATYYGRFDEAIAESRRVIELNPLGAFEQSHLVWILYQTRHFEEALAAGRKLVADNPHYSHGLVIYCYLLRYLGRTGEAIEQGAQLVEAADFLGTELADEHAGVLARLHQARAFQLA